MDDASPHILRLTAPARATEPYVTWSQRCAVGGGTVTAIARGWPPGMSWTDCRRCPADYCNLTDGHCLVQAPVKVRHADASDFSLAAHLGLAAPGDDRLLQGRPRARDEA